MIGSDCRVISVLTSPGGPLQVERLKRERLTILLAGQGSSSRWRSPTGAMSLKKARVRHAGPAAQVREDVELRNQLFAL